MSDDEKQRFMRVLVAVFVVILLLVIVALLWFFLTKERFETGSARSNPTSAPLSRA